MQTNLTCPICGSAFTPRAVGGKPQRYCSTPCRLTAKEQTRRSKRPPHPTMADRFWAKVDRAGGPIACWPWTGARYSNGYGAFQVGGAKVTGGYQTTAHRVALALHRGVPVESIDKGCHTCDNPPCCNPAHLFDDTQAGNMDDMRQKGRRKRTGPPGGQLTEDLVRQIRTEYAAGDISQQSLAILYGVDQTTVSRVILRQIWKHIA